MLKRLQQLTGSLVRDTFAGIEVRLSESGDYELRYVLLSSRQQEVELTDSGSGWEGLQPFTSGFLNTLPVALCFTGRGVLHKVVPTGDRTIQEVFPTFTLDDFYTDKASYGAYDVHAVVRKDIVEEVMETLTSRGLFVVRVYLGALPVFSAGRSLLENGPVHTQTYTLTAYELPEVATRIGEEELEEVEVAGEQVPAENVIGLYSGVASFAGVEGVAIPDATQQAAEQKFIRWNKRLIPAATLFFLVVLLGNYIVFQQTTHTLNDVSAVNRTISAEVLDLRVRQTRVQQRSRLLGDASRNPRVSVAFDRIGASIPRDIVLEQLAMFPLTSDLTDPREPLVFTGERLIVRGVSFKSEVFSNWLLRLADLDFVQDVSIVSFQFNERNATYPFQLEVQVTL